MAKFVTRKATSEARKITLDRKARRAVKYAVTK